MTQLAPPPPDIHGFDDDRPPAAWSPGYRPSGPGFGGGRPPRPPRGKGRSGVHWIAAVGIWSVVLLVVWSLARPNSGGPLHDPTARPKTVAPRPALTPAEQATIRVFKETSPSIVHITNIALRRGMFSLNVFQIPRGSGSGFVWDKQGHIVTNYHVVEGASALEVTLADHKPVRAQLVAKEPDKDLAVLKIDVPASLLIPVRIGSSSDLQVGQRVLAIGNPFGLDRTLTTGVVSALGREIEAVNGRKIRGVIQTDAAINPGNSGGPLLDSAGRLVGVNTQIASPSGASAGIGFAIPVDTVNEIVPDLIRYGFVRRPVLGVNLAEDWVARRLGVPGVIIQSVTEGGGAARAGLRGWSVDDEGYLRRLGDIIVKINDKEVSSLVEIRNALDPFKSGDKVTVTYIRDNKVLTTEVELQYVQPL
ncbi:MAG: S1C family serine protease [Phycisphaerae bacterium]